MKDSKKQTEKYRRCSVPQRGRHPLIKAYASFMPGDGLALYPLSMQK